MGFWKAYLWAAAGAGIVLVLGLRLIDFVRPDNWLNDTLQLAPTMLVYAFGGTLIGGVIGLQVLRTLEWERLPFYQGVGIVGGILLGAIWFIGAGVLVFAKASLLFGMMGLVAASVYWALRHRAA